MREREHLQLQVDLQAKMVQANADARLREVEGANTAEMIRAMREHMTAILEAHVKPIGILWIDAFNALLSPAIVCLLMVLFAVVYVPFAWEVVTHLKTGIMTAEQAHNAIGGSMVGIAIEGALGFLFGARGYQAGKRLAG